MNKFDELTRQLAHSTTRRAALRTFGNGLAALALAFLGLANNVQAKPALKACVCDVQYFGCHPKDVKCIQNCAYRCS